MQPKITAVLDHAVLAKLLEEHTPVEEIVQRLFTKGAELANIIMPRSYGSFEDFKKAHAKGDSELVELEGPSDISTVDVVILKGCPMSTEMKKLGVNGVAPTFFKQIVQDYIDQNPGSEAILHPGCIAHQVARQLIVKHINIEGHSDLNFFQLACRNMATGEIIYDRNGLEKIGMSRETAAGLIEGQACLYAIVKSQL